MEYVKNSIDVSIKLRSTKSNKKINRRNFNIIKAEIKEKAVLIHIRFIIIV